jgi:hypothetical protein
MTRTERARVNPDGTVVAVYTDAIDLRVVGHVRAVRASAVEWDEGRQAWVARILATGEALGPFPTRAAAVDAERTVLGAHLFTGTAPGGAPLAGPARSREPSRGGELRPFQLTRAPLS